MKKRIISAILVIGVILSIFTLPVSAYSQEKITIPQNMTLEDFLKLSNAEKNELVMSCCNFSNSYSNARYKSGEKDPTHAAISSTAIGTFINDKGFWKNGAAGLNLALTISIYSLAPDQSDDEAYIFGNGDHFYVVSTGKGQGISGKSASDRFVEYFNKAVNEQKKETKKKLQCT